MMQRAELRVVAGMASVAIAFFLIMLSLLVGQAGSERAFSVQDSGLSRGAENEDRVGVGRLTVQLYTAEHDRFGVVRRGARPLPNVPVEVIDLHLPVNDTSRVVSSYTDPRGQAGFLLPQGKYQIGVLHTYLPFNSTLSLNATNSRALLQVTFHTQQIGSYVMSVRDNYRSGFAFPGDAIELQYRAAGGFVPSLFQVQYVGKPDASISRQDTIQVEYYLTTLTPKDIISLDGYQWAVVTAKDPIAISRFDEDQNLKLVALWRESNLLFRP